MQGKAITAMVTTDAPTTPVVAASNAPTNTTDIAKPPRIRPNKRPIVSNNCSAIPDFSSMTPIKTNNGTANKVKLVMMPQIRSGKRLKKSKPRKKLPKPSATAPSVNATGKPSSKNKNNTANMTKAQTSIIEPRCYY